MELIEKLHRLDAAFVEGRVEDAANEYVDKQSVTHIQNLVTLKGKSATLNLASLRDSIGSDGNIEVLAQRVLDAENSTVTLFSVDNGGTDSKRLKSLFLLARRFNDKGKVVEEEILPVGSSNDAQPYFPDVRLSPKQVQPRLSFITTTRKKKGRSAGRPPKPAKETDLHRLAMIGPKVLRMMKEAGINTFQQLADSSDEVLQSVRDFSGRKLSNFDFSYWREAAKLAVLGDWDKIPPAPSPKTAKLGKRTANTDFSKLNPDEIQALPKVGPKLLEAMHNANLHTFSDLAHASDETLESLREPAGRPFVNFNMTYFRTAARKVVDGSKSVPAPPAPSKPKAEGQGKRGGKKSRPTNPNDIHILPGVGAQLVKALHEKGINTFSDIAEASNEVLTEARSQTKGKYKNIDIAYLKRQAKHAAAGNFDKIESPVKIDKSLSAADPKANLDERFQDKLRANPSDIGVLPGVGPGIRAALNAKGIKTMNQLASAKVETLREVAATSGRRFAQFDVNFWKEAATHMLAQEYDKVPRKAPVAAKKKGPARKRGPKGGPRVQREAPQPQNNRDLAALPTVGATVVRHLQDAGLDTFEKIAKASDQTLTQVRDSAGPRFKTFDVSYWRTVAALAAEGRYKDYPDAPKVKKKVKVKAERKQRERKVVSPTKLEKLSGVGPALAQALRDNGIQTWHDLVDAEKWQVQKALTEAGKRSRNVDPEDLKRLAKDAINGKFPEKQKRVKGSKLPEGYQDFSQLPGLGKVVSNRLHEIGVKTYADLSRASIGTLEEIRDSVKGRVAKSNVREWKEYGRLAASNEWSKIDPSKYAESDDASKKPQSKRPKAPKDGDQLTNIKGVGPQAQSILVSRGIRTYEAVAKLSDDVLMSILEESGPRSKVNSPDLVRASAQDLARGGDGKTAKADKSKATPAAKAPKSGSKPKGDEKAKIKADSKVKLKDGKSKSKSK